jgi:hypothetical protein
MATKSAILAVKIISDAKDFKKGTDEAASAIDKLAGGMKKLAVPAIAIGAGLLKLGSDYTKMASDFEQNAGAVDAVFKGHNGEVDKLAANSAKKLGISGSDYLKYSALIGSQMKNAGVPMDKLVGKTDALINTGADLAAQFGGTMPDAVEAMSSALKGEFDPIEKYGISLSAAKIEAEAMAMGAEKVNGAFTDQAKQAAILSLINKQGADAQGANAREAGTAAGVHARLTAAYEDMGAKLGTMLLPVLSTLGELLGKVVDWVTQNSELVGVLAVGLGLLVAAILVLNGAMLIMNIIAALNPFVLIGVAVAALIGFIIYLATQTSFFGDLWANVSKFAADVWNGFVKFATDVWNGFVGFLQDTLRNIGNFFGTIFGNIGNFVGSVLRNIGNFFTSVFNGARNIVSGVINWIIGAFNNVSNTVSSVLTSIGSWFNSVFQGINGFVTGVINGVADAFRGISSAVQGVIGWVRSLFNGFSVPGWLREVMKFMGVGATGFDMALGYDLSGLPADMGATGTMGFGGIFSGGGSNKTEVHNYNITINGALDPNAVAKQLKTIINSDAKRNGTISAGGSMW